MSVLPSVGEIIIFNVSPNKQKWLIDLIVVDILLPFIIIGRETAGFLLSKIKPLSTAITLSLPMSPINDDFSFWRLDRVVSDWLV
jgi:hypothetical protein